MDDIKIIDEYLTEIKRNKPMNTFKAYTYSCKVLKEYIEISGKNLFFFSSPHEAEQYVMYLQDMELNTRTIKHRITVLRQVIEFAQNKGYLPKTDLKVKFNPKDKIEFVDKSVIRDLYNYCSSYDDYDDFLTLRAKTEILLILLFGFKVSDIGNLQVNDLNIENKEITSQSIIKYIYDEKFVPIIKRYLSERAFFISEFENPSDYMFINRYGKQIEYCTVNLDLVKICKDLKLKQISCSALRSTCILYYYEKFPDGLLISKIFGITKNRIDEMKKG